MPDIKECLFTYQFPANWVISKFDELPFYLRHFQNFAGGCAAVDVWAFAPHQDEVWLIEAKDYRAYPRLKSSDIFDEMALKALGTLACMVAARANASDGLSEVMATTVLRKPKLKIRFVLHLEQPQKPSKLFPQVVDPKSAKDKMRQKLRAVDPHAIVGDKALLNKLMAWQVI